MNARQHRQLVNLNRVLILSLSVSGLLLDGLQQADLPCILAVFVWLWLPLFTRLESHLLRWAGDRAARVSPFLSFSTRHHHHRSQP